MYIVAQRIFLSEISRTEKIIDVINIKTDETLCDLLAKLAKQNPVMDHEGITKSGIISETNSRFTVSTHFLNAFDCTYWLIKPRDSDPDKSIMDIRIP